MVVSTANCKSFSNIQFWFIVLWFTTQNNHATRIKWQTTWCQYKRWLITFHIMTFYIKFSFQRIYILFLFSQDQMRLRGPSAPEFWRGPQLAPPKGAQGLLGFSSLVRSLPWRPCVAVPSDSFPHTSPQINRVLQQLLTWSYKIAGAWMKICRFWCRKYEWSGMLISRTH